MKWFFLCHITEQSHISIQTEKSELNVFYTIVYNYTWEFSASKLLYSSMLLLVYTHPPWMYAVQNSMIPISNLARRGKFRKLTANRKHKTENEFILCVVYSLMFSHQSTNIFWNFANNAWKSYCLAPFIRLLNFQRILGVMILDSVRSGYWLLYYPKLYIGSTI